MNILLYGIDKNIQSDFSEYINFLGHETTIVDTAKQFDILVEGSKHIHMIILDIANDRIDNLNEIKKIKDKLDDDVFIISLLPNNDPKIITQAINSGVNDYLIKPFLENEYKLKLHNSIAYLESLESIKECKVKSTYLQRVLHSINNVNQIIIRQTDTASLLKSICVNLVETKGFYNAWIALYDQQGNFDSFVEWRDGSNQQLYEDLKTNKKPHCIKKSLKNKGLHIIDPESPNCNKCKNKDSYDSFCALSIQLSFNNQIFGVLTVSAARYYIDNVEEHYLFEEMAENISYALYNIINHEQIHLLSEIINNLTNPISLVSTDYKYLVVNPAYSNFYNTDIKNITGKKISHFLGEEFFQKNIKSNLDKCLQGNEINYKTEVDYKKIGKRWMEMRYLPFKDNKGNIIGILSHGMDITDRIKAKEQLLKNEENFRLLTENSIDVIWTMDTKLNFTYLSPSVKDIFGVKPEEWINTHLSTHFTKKEFFKAGGYALKALKTYKTFGHVIFESKMLDKDGKEIDIEVNGKVLLDGKGKLKGLQGTTRDIRKRKANERENTRILQHSHDLICIAGFDGYFKYVNPTWEKLLGYTMDELLSKPFLDFIHPDDHQKNDTELSNLALGNETVNFDNRYITKYGDIKYISWTATPLVEENILYGFGRDITENKTTEMRLKESEIKFRSLYQQSPDMYASVSPKTAEILECNNTFLNKMGYKKEQVIGSPIFNMYHSDCMEEVHDAFEEFVDKGFIKNRELILKTNSGNKIEVSLNVNSVKDEKGNVLYSISSWRDIGEKKQNNEKIKYQAKLLDSVSDAIISTDENFIIQTWNKAAEEIYGWSSQEAIGNEYRILVQVDYLDIEREQVLEEFITKGSWSGDSIQVNKDGLPIYIHSSISTIKAPNGQIIGVVGINRDITENKHIENLLRQKKQELESTLDSISDGVISTDINGDIYRVNQRVKKLLEIPIENLIGANFHTIFKIRNEITNDLVTLNFDKLIQERINLSIDKEIILHRENKSPIPISITATPVLNEINNVIGSVIVIRDQSQTAINQMLINARYNLFNFSINHTLSEFVNRSIYKANDFVNSSIGFYHFVASDQESLTQQHWWSKSKNLLSTSELIKIQFENNKNNILWDCIREGIPILQNDYNSYLDAKDLSKSDTPIKSALIVPVFKTGKVVAVLGVFNTSELFNDKDISIVSYLADVIWEIIQQKMTEFELANTANEWQKTFDIVKDAIFLLDKDNNILRSNLAAEKLFNSSQKALTGTKCWKIVHDDDQPHVDCPVIKAQNTFKRESMELPMKDKWFHISADPIISENNQYNGAVHIIRDITKNKQDAKVLEKLSSAIDQAAETIVITDIDGKIEYTNPAFEKISGYSKEEVLGKSPKILKSGHQNKEFYESLWTTIKNGETWQGIFKNRRKDNSLYDEEAVISPVFDKDGTIINFVAVKRDITKEMRLEKQLNQAQKMEAVGRLAGGVAHDFNNMLSVILGYSEIILSKLEPNTSFYDDLEQIHKAAEKSMIITRQLLAFARKESISPENINLNKSIEDSIKMLKRLIGEDIELLWKPVNKTIQIEFDPSQLDQVLANLCINARDAIQDTGQISIITDTIAIDQTLQYNDFELTQGKYHILKVSDSGCGMSKEIQERIFEPFFTTKESGKGTGLGLATIFGIVKQNNCNIFVDSKINVGTTFTIFFRALATKELQKTQSVQFDLPRGNGENIVIVEDEVSILKLVQKTLTFFNYNVVTFDNPVDALEYLNEHSSEFSLLISDVVMPKLNGKKLAEKVQKLNPIIQVLFMSGYNTEIIEERGILKENVNFIQKPFSRTALAKLVHKLIKHKN